MPVSRCARLKNDRRGAKPGSTASPSLSLSFFVFLLVFLYLDPPLSCHPSLSLSRRRVVLFALTLENRISLFIALNLGTSFFSMVPFFGVQLAPPGLVRFTRGLCFVLLQLSRNTPAHPFVLPLPLFASFCVPSAPSMLLLIFGYRFIDLLSEESPARDKTSTASAAYFYEDEDILSYVIQCDNIQ